MSHSDIVSPRGDGLPDLDDYVAEICDALDGTSASVDSFRAFWDGDTTGWMVCFDALAGDGSVLWGGGLRGAGGDLRLFNGIVPPWPEVPYAVELGRRLATIYRVQFVFERGDGPFGTSPCPSNMDFDSLLDELCVDLELCLEPDQRQHVVSAQSGDAIELTNAIFAAGRLDPRFHPMPYWKVLERVEQHCQRAEK